MKGAQWTEQIQSLVTFPEDLYRVKGKPQEIVICCMLCLPWMMEVSVSLEACGNN